MPAAVTTRATDGDQTEVHGRLGQCGAPATLVELVKDCLATDPAGRPADAGAVARRIAAYREESEVVPPALVESPADERRVSGVFAATALTIACVMAALIVPRLRANVDPPPMPTTVEQPITTG